MSPLDWLLNVGKVGEGEQAVRGGADRRELRAASRLSPLGFAARG